MPKPIRYVDSTQLWELGEALLPLIKKELEAHKLRFPGPIVIG